MTEPINQANETETTETKDGAENPTEPIELQPDADERLQVLRLLEGGDITADEADALLDALEEDEPAGRRVGGSTGNEETGRPRGYPEGGKTARDGGQTGREESVAAEPVSTGGSGGQGSRLRIRITEHHSQKPTVNLTLPLGFLDMGLGIARRVAPNRVPDQATLKSVLLGGFKGSLIDINDDGDRVEIFVE